MLTERGFCRSLCSKCFMCFLLIIIFTKSYEVTLVINFILQRKKLNKRELKKLSQGHVAIHGGSGIGPSSRVCALPTPLLTTPLSAEVRRAGFTREPLGFEEFDKRSSLWQLILIPTPNVYTHMCLSLLYQTCNKPVLR